MSYVSSLTFFICDQAFIEGYDRLAIFNIAQIIEDAH